MPFTSISLQTADLLPLTHPHFVGRSCRISFWCCCQFQLGAAINNIYLPLVGVQDASMYVCVSVCLPVYPVYPVYPWHFYSLPIPSQPISFRLWPMAWHFSWFSFFLFFSFLFFICLSLVSFILCQICGYFSWYQFKKGEQGVEVGKLFAHFLQPPSPHCA